MKQACRSRIETDVPYRGARREGQAMTISEVNRARDAADEDTRSRGVNSPATCRAGVTDRLEAADLCGPATDSVDSPDDTGMQSARISGAVCREFEASLANLRAVTEQIQRTENAGGVDSVAFARAHESYRRARLVWLSSEIMLRSSAMHVSARAPVRVLSIQRAEPVAASYEILLRVNGYPVASLDRHAGLDALLASFAPQVVLLDLDERLGAKLAFAVSIRQWQRENRRAVRIVGLASRRLAGQRMPLMDVVVAKPATLCALMDVLRVD
jgi:hypothetical protein